MKIVIITNMLTLSLPDVISSEPLGKGLTPQKRGAAGV
jgi:hypothetical protein